MCVAGRDRPARTLAGAADASPAGVSLAAGASLPCASPFPPRGAACRPFARRFAAAGAHQRFLVGARDHHHRRPVHQPARRRLPSASLRRCRASDPRVALRCDDRPRTRPPRSSGRSGASRSTRPPACSRSGAGSPTGWCASPSVSVAFSTTTCVSAGLATALCRGAPRARGRVPAGCPLPGLFDPPPPESSTAASTATPTTTPPAISAARFARRGLLFDAETGTPASAPARNAAHAARRWPAPRGVGARRRRRGGGTRRQRFGLAPERAVLRALAGPAARARAARHRQGGIHDTRRHRGGRCRGGTPPAAVAEAARRHGRLRFTAARVRLLRLRAGRLARAQPRRRRLGLSAAGSGRSPTAAELALRHRLVATRRRLGASSSAVRGRRGLLGAGLGSSLALRAAGASGLRGAATAVCAVGTNAGWPGTGARGAAAAGAQRHRHGRRAGRGHGAGSPGDRRRWLAGGGRAP